MARSCRSAEASAGRIRSSVSRPPAKAACLMALDALITSREAQSTGRHRLVLTRFTVSLEAIGRVWDGNNRALGIQPRTNRPMEPMVVASATSRMDGSSGRLPLVFLLPASSRKSSLYKRVAECAPGLMPHAHLLCNIQGFWLKRMFTELICFPT